MSSQRIVAVALVTQSELQLLGKAFDRAWPVEDTPCFSGLLQAIDEADRAIRCSNNQDEAGDRTE